MKSIFKSLGYVLVYLFAQMLASIVVTVQGVSKDITIELLDQYMMDNILLIVILGNIFAVLIIWLIDRWHHKNHLVREGKLNVKDAIIYILLGFTFSMSFNLLMSNFGVENTADLYAGISYFDQLAPNFGYIMFVLAVVVAAPIAEEYIFRYVIVNKLQDQFNPYLAISISAIIFGLLHGTSIFVMIGAALMGIVFGYVYIKTSSLMIAIFTHMAANSLPLFFEYLPDFNLATMIVLSVIFGIIFLGLLWYINNNSQITINENKRVAIE